MGIDVDSAGFLVAARRAGVPFDRTATLGRQNLYLSRSEGRRLFGDRAVAADWLNGGYADQFFTALGVDVLDTIDASAFEGAAVVHDLNEPLPEGLVDKYDAVIDVGVLEHVFDFPQAIANCMRLPRQ